MSVPRITPETPAHARGVRALLLAAFPTPAEADLVERLRRDGDAAIALVAIEEGDVAGHIVFSPMQAPMRALGLGPVAIAPNRQRRGIASDLIRSGLDLARAEGWDAVFVLGDPAFYARFGFSTDAASRFACKYAGPHFMALALDGRDLRQATGTVVYAPAFDALT
ncbi:MAG: GNAT family N-acetyltransferase [Hyphomicrobium sp.]|uniref:GNAT family N-acetyltransferase n=1 Tax=Hyphomicrobium sp. TaxID=82 RepID=UPI003D0C31DE